MRPSDARHLILEQQLRAIRRHEFTRSRFAPKGVASWAAVALLASTALSGLAATDGGGEAGGNCECASPFRPSPPALPLYQPKYLPAAAE